MAESSTNNSLIPNLVPGTLHVRSHTPGAERTATLDLAMVAKSVLDTGGSVAVQSDSNMHDFTSALGYGWREPRIHRLHAATILSTLAGWYHATATGDSPVLFIERLDYLAGFAVENLNVDTAEFVRALLAGDERRLFELTGLDRGVMLRSKRLAPLPKAVVVAGVTRRKGYATDTISGLMVSQVLVQTATTISSFDQPYALDDIVAVSARWLKNRDVGSTGDVELFHPRDELAPWAPRR